MRYLIVFILIVAMLSGALYAYSFFTVRDRGATMAFINIYGEYAAQIETVDQQVYFPGQGENLKRKNMHKLLSDILIGDIDNGKRLQLAREAEDLAAAQRLDIDAVAQNRHRHEQIIDEAEVLVSDLAPREAEIASAIVHHATTRQAFISDISATLYAINGHIDAIAGRVIEEEGALSSDHIAHINEATRDAEERFDRLNNLYRDLKDETEALEAAYQRLVEYGI